MRKNIDKKTQPNRRKSRLAGGVAASILMGLCSALGAQAQSAGKPVQIRIAGSDTINAATPFFVAQRQGYFKEAGIEITYITMAGGAAAMAAAMKAKELDIGLGAASQYMSDVAKGVVSGKLIGEFTDNNYLILGGNGITDPKQLKGKIFAISSYNGGDQLYARAVLSHFGIGPDDITWLPVGTPASRLSALVTGKVDAMEMPITSLPESAKGRVIVGADDSPVPFVSSAIFARQDFLNDNKVVLQKFLKAIGKGSDWIRANPKDAETVCLDSGANAADCKTAVSVATASKNPYTWSSTTKVNVEAIEDMIPIVAVAAPKAANMKVADFVDTSIAGAP